MSLDAADLEGRFDRLMGQGVYVTDVTVEGGVLHVGHETLAERGVPKREAGRILDVLVEAHQQGEWEPTEVRGWVFEADTEGAGDDGREQRGTWRAEPGWFRALANGNLSETDFSTLVVSTIEVTG